MALPPNWVKYTTEDGKDYYHNAVSNTTQWDKPERTGELASSLSFQSNASEVFQYKPTTDLDVTPRVVPAASESAGMAGMAIPESEMVEAVGRSPGGKVQTLEEEHNDQRVSLSGSAAASSQQTSAGLGSGFVGGMIAAASEEDGSWVSGMAGSALVYAQQFFDVTSDEVMKRMRLSLNPLASSPPVHGGVNEFRAKPDFWGPFWIATTNVLFLAATGNFARLLDTKDHATFKSDYGLVSLAAMMIYGCLVFVPLVTQGFIYLGDAGGDVLNVRQMICVYGYSLAPLVPTSIACLIPMNLIRWLAILVGFGVSLAFMQGYLWKSLATEAPSLRWKIVGLVCAAQAAIFLTYRMHFFSSA